MRGKGAILMAAALLGLASPAHADTPPATTQAQAESLLAAAPKGTRFGLLVVDDTDKIVVSINPDGRFIPASNTKMFTTAAAYALLPGMDQPDVGGGAAVWLESSKRKGVQDVVLYGNGDARMSSASDCVTDCLARLADAIATKSKIVGDIIGVDTLYPDQRWSPGMSWNNIGSNDATAASALSLDSNELVIRVTPAKVGQRPNLVASPYLSIQNVAFTSVPGGKSSLKLVHTINSREFRLIGELPADASEWHEIVGVDDPALYSASRLQVMLRQRGVRVVGVVRTQHRPIDLNDDPVTRPIGVDPNADVARDAPLARLTPPPLAEDVTIINKVSQNNHAELLLRRVASIEGSSLEDGLAAERAVFDKAGIPREGYDFSDGSGMSTYNRVSPRAAVALLRWIDTQPWGKAWYASLPIAGVDGTLRNRFKGTSLENNLIAKTGTLNATNAISGTFRAASGKRLTFAFFANDVPDGQSAVPAMESVLLLVAAAN
ncbi:MAG: D-alanyl-D-alanine carboxypeptidase/D-alanyl-D-alanine-endopeptidase [Novosphingobium sp.]